jgi:uncharacterized protein (TIGR03067 family)
MMGMDFRNGIAILVGFACALATADARAADAGRETAKGDLARLQGSWTLVDFAYYRDGERLGPDDENKSGELIFTATGYRLKLKIGSVDIDNLYTIKLIAGTNPKAFDVTMPDGTLIEGIYELKGDTLRRCFSGSTGTRPEKFQDGNQTYQVWRRSKEKTVPMPAAPP